METEREKISAENALKGDVSGPQNRNVSDQTPLSLNSKRKRLSSGENRRSRINRIRTPSGTVLSKTVKDIRTFFSPNHRKPRTYSTVTNVRGAFKVLSKNSQKRGCFKYSPIGSEVRSVNKSTKRKLINKSKKLKEKTGDESLIDFLEKSENNISIDNQVNTSTEDFLTPDSYTDMSDIETDETGVEMLSSPHKGVITTGAMHPFEENLSTVIQKLEQQGGEKAVNASQATQRDTDLKEVNEDENPQLMSVSAVVQMFKQLQAQCQKARIGQEQEISKQIQKFKEEAVQELSELDVFRQAEGSDDNDLRAEVEQWKHKSEVLTDVVDRMHHEIQDLTQRLENVELSTTKKSIIVTGLQVAPEKVQNWAMLDYIFKDVIGASSVIDDFYMLGSNFVVALQTMECKRQIMLNKNKLRKIRGKEGQKIYINDFVPTTTQEKRRREREIVSALDQQGKSQSVSYTKAGLTVNGIPYRKKVLPPTPKELVNMEVDKLEEVLKMKIKKDAEITQENSVFSAYVANADVKSHAEVRDYYRKMKLIQPGARHIVCAYYIKHPDEHYSKDYHDDGEPGAGRTLLNILVQNNLQNCVVFVARKYGGVRMGPERFQCYAESVKAALMSHGIQIKSSSGPDYKKRQNEQQSMGPPQSTTNPTRTGRVEVQQMSSSSSVQPKADVPPYPQPLPQRNRGGYSQQGGRRFNHKYSGRSGAVRGARGPTTQQMRDYPKPNHSAYSYNEYSKMGQLFPNQFKTFENFQDMPPTNLNDRNPFGLRYVNNDNNESVD